MPGPTPNTPPFAIAIFAWFTWYRSSLSASLPPYRKLSTRLIHVSTRLVIPEDVFATITVSPLCELCRITAARIKNTRGIAAMPIVIKICFVLALPINNKTRQLAPSNNAVERLAGAINMQTSAIGIMIGRNPFLKSFIMSCFLLISLARYMKRASLARSEVCMVMLIRGKRIHLLPSFIRTPKNKV